MAQRFLQSKVSGKLRVRVNSTESNQYFYISTHCLC